MALPRALFLVALSADLIANDKPLLITYDGGVYVPIVRVYAETEFGGDFDTEADYRDPYVQDLINAKGWMLWPPIRFSYDTINYNLPTPAPSAPSAENWLGTDDQGRDVLARVMYGFRLSVLFGLALTVLSSIIGVFAGAMQGYFGGWLDLIMQRVIEFGRPCHPLYFDYILRLLRAGLLDAVIYLIAVFVGEPC